MGQGYDPHGMRVGKNCSLSPAVADRICPPGADPEVCEGCSHSTGEACGQVFWVKLAQRLHRLRPLNETYPAEIERVILNGIISQIPPKDAVGPARPQFGNATLGFDVVGIRQFALLHKKKMKVSNISTCCEGQVTRLLGSLPECEPNTHLLCLCCPSDCMEGTAQVHIHLRQCQRCGVSRPVRAG